MVSLSRFRLKHCGCRDDLRDTVTFLLGGEHSAADDLETPNGKCKRFFFFTLLSHSVVFWDAYV